MLDKLVVWALTLKAKLSSERGQDLMEYALLGGFIAVLFAVAAVGVLNSGLFSNMVHIISNCVDFNNGTACGP